MLPLALIGLGRRTGCPNREPGDRPSIKRNPNPGGGPEGDIDDRPGPLRPFGHKPGHHQHKKAREAGGRSAMMASASPCVGICRLDETTGYCVGCARTGDEVALWRDASETERQAVWDDLPARFETLGLTCRRLAWNDVTIRKFVAESFQHRKGTWVLGVIGAVAEVPCAASVDVRLTERGSMIEAVSEGAALRLDIDPETRALCVRRPGMSETLDVIVLARLRAKLRLPVAATVQELSADENAIDPGAAHDRLFDLGLGRRAARFCVRTRDERLIGMLRGQVGQPWSAALPVIGRALIEASPVRVIETGCGRAEIATPIPRPEGRSSDGPHTHFLPEHIASGRDAPVGIDLPAIYAAGAILYPPAGT